MIAQGVCNRRETMPESTQAQPLRNQHEWLRNLAQPLRGFAWRNRRNRFL
jgi:hypothetical protein